MTQTKARIRTEIYDAAKLSPAWASVLTRERGLHIAIMREPFLSYILTGKKTVESRFSINRIAPYQKVGPGDIILMKSGPIIGCFVAEWVKFYDLTEKPIEDIIATLAMRFAAIATFGVRKTTSDMRRSLASTMYVS